MPVDSAKLLEFSVETGLDSPLDTQGDYLVLTPVNLELLLHAKALQTFFQCRATFDGTCASYR